MQDPTQSESEIADYAIAFLGISLIALSKLLYRIRLRIRDWLLQLKAFVRDPTQDKSEMTDWS